MHFHIYLDKYNFLANSQTLDFTLDLFTELSLEISSLPLSLPMAKISLVQISLVKSVGLNLGSAYNLLVHEGSKDAECRFCIIYILHLSNLHNSQDIIGPVSPSFLGDTSSRDPAKGQLFS